MPIDKIHYLDSNSLTPAQKMHEDRLRTIISQYGVNSTYFRHDAAFYETPSNNYLDYIYGEDTTMTFNISAPVRIYIDMATDVVIMKQMGIETNADGDAYMVIDDFTEQFRDRIGKPVFTNVSVLATGTLQHGKGTLKADIDNGCIKGFVEIEIDVNYEAGGVTGDVVDAPFQRYPISYNPFVLNSGEYADREVTGGLSGTWCGIIDDEGNGDIEAVLEGNLFYYVGPAQGAGPNWKVAPQVGDFFRLEFDQTTGNLEEYEITQIEHRNLQDDGLSPLMGSYVWKMSVKRRDPSHEIVIGDDCEDSVQEEPWTVDKLRISNLNELISDEIFDYRDEEINDIDGVNSDQIYGGYDMEPEPVIPEEEAPDCPDIDDNVIVDCDDKLLGYEVNVNPIDPTQCTGSVNFITPATIELNAEVDEDIYYTLDGTEPSMGSTLYTGPITITQDTIVRSKTFDTLFNETGEYTDYVTFMDPENESTMYMKYGDHTGFILSGDVIDQLWNMTNRPRRIIDLIDNRDPADFERAIKVIHQFVPCIFLSVGKNAQNEVADLNVPEDYQHTVELIDSIVTYTDKVLIKNFCELLSKSGDTKIMELISLLRDKGVTEIMVENWASKPDGCEDHKEWDIDSILMYMDSESYTVRVDKATAYQRHQEDALVYYTYDHEGQQGLYDAEQDTPQSSIDLMEMGLLQQNTSRADIQWVPTWTETYNPFDLNTIAWIESVY